MYVGFTVAEIVLLWLGDMTLFESVAHSFTTMSTGGFGTDVGSLGAFSAYAQWVVIAFMVIAGASFALHYRALRRPAAYLENAELRIYLGILVAAAVVATLGTWGGAVAATVRDAAQRHREHLADEVGENGRCVSVYAVRGR